MIMGGEVVDELSAVNDFLKKIPEILFCKAEREHKVDTNFMTPIPEIKAVSKSYPLSYLLVSIVFFSGSIEFVQRVFFLPSAQRTDEMNSFHKIMAESLLK